MVHFALGVSSRLATYGRNDAAQGCGRDDQECHRKCERGRSKVSHVGFPSKGGFGRPFVRESRLTPGPLQADSSARLAKLVATVSVGSANPLLRNRTGPVQVPGGNPVQEAWGWRVGRLG